MSLSSTELARAFNSLPRPLNLTESQRTARQWHFDIRYWHIEPNPCHILLLFQHETDVAHMTRLPLGISPHEPGHAYFPETPEDAAPGIVKALLQNFVNRRFLDIRGNETRRPPKPRKFTTYDGSLARAVGNELERLGVSSALLRTVDITPDITQELAQQRFSQVFEVEVDRVVRTAGFRLSQRPSTYTPRHVDFGQARSQESDDDLEGETEEERFKDLVHEYTVLMLSVSPPDGRVTRGPQACQRYSVRCTEIFEVLTRFSVHQVRSAADLGEPSAAVEYGIRRLLGVQCEPDRGCAREYFLKAALSRSASSEDKAMAHGLLCEWYWETITNFASEPNCVRHIFAAWHHANKSAELCKRVSPPGAFSSKTVLEAIGPMAGTSIEQIEFRIFYPFMSHAYRAHKIREDNSRLEWQQKRGKNLNRYRCACESCEIETDSGYMLSQCSGPCDKDKKPSYCSKDCQIEDWGTHRPFCREGAPCSVTKSDDFQEFIAQAPAREHGAGLLFLPLHKSDGSRTLIGSGTLNGEELSTMKDDFEEDWEVLGPFYLFDVPPGSTKNIHEE